MPKIPVSAHITIEHSDETIVIKIPVYPVSYSADLVELEYQTGVTEIIKLSIDDVLEDEDVSTKKFIASMSDYLHVNSEIEQPSISQIYKTPTDGSHILTRISSLLTTSETYDPNYEMIKVSINDELQNKGDDTAYVLSIVKDLIKPYMPQPSLLAYNEIISTMAINNLKGNEILACAKKHSIIPGSNIRAWRAYLYDIMKNLMHDPNLMPVYEDVISVPMLQIQYDDMFCLHIYEGNFNIDEEQMIQWIRSFVDTFDSSAPHITVETIEDMELLDGLLKDIHNGFTYKAVSTNFDTTTTSVMNSKETQYLFYLLDCLRNSRNPIGIDDFNYVPPSVSMKTDDTDIDYSKSADYPCPNCGNAVEILDVYAENGILFKCDACHYTQDDFRLDLDELNAMNNGSTYDSLHANIYYRDTSHGPDSDDMVENCYRAVFKYPCGVCNALMPINDINSWYSHVTCPNCGTLRENLPFLRQTFIDSNPVYAEYIPKKHPWVIEVAPLHIEWERKPPTTNTGHTDDAESNNDKNDERSTVPANEEKPIYIGPHRPRLLINNREDTDRETNALLFKLAFMVGGLNKSEADRLKIMNELTEEVMCTDAGCRYGMDRVLNLMYNPVYLK